MGLDPAAPSSVSSQYWRVAFAPSPALTSTKSSRSRTGGAEVRLCRQPGVSLAAPAVPRPGPQSSSSGVAVALVWYYDYVVRK